MLRGGRPRSNRCPRGNDRGHLNKSGVHQATAGCGPCQWSSEAVGEGLALADALGLALADALGLALADALGDAPAEPLGLAEADPDGDGDAVDADANVVQSDCEPWTIRSVRPRAWLGVSTFVRASAPPTGTMRPGRTATRVPRLVQVPLQRCSFQVPGVRFLRFT